MGMGDFEKDDLEKVLPSEITDVAVRFGNELVIPFKETKRAISIAAQNLIAVLGVEGFRILGEQLGVVTYSGYEFKFDGDWADFVLLNSDAALHFIDENALGKGYGYILTTTSENEFNHLRT
jgi:hypothetical protein